MFSLCVCACILTFYTRANKYLTCSEVNGLAVAVTEAPLFTFSAEEASPEASPSRNFASAVQLPLVKLTPSWGLRG